MAEEEETVAPVDVDHEDDPNYQPPPEKSIDDMLQADKDDESLQKYKAALLGGAVAGSGAIVVEPEDPRKVIVKKLSLVSEGREDSTIDLTQDLATIKTKSFVLKEGVKFRIKIDFIVQREIVHGLKYVQKTYRYGIRILHHLFKFTADTKTIVQFQGWNSCRQNESHGWLICS